jgi:cytoskeletal protein RodZ
MPTVAEQLRRAREARNLTVYQVAEITKLKTDHVRALEDGNFEAFSAPVYIRGFVRTYANVLKLEVPKLMSTLDEELAQTEKFRDPPPLGGQAHGWLDFWMLQLSKVNWRLVLPVFSLAVLVALAIWGVRAWQARQTKDPLAGLGPGLYQAPTNATAETLPLPTNAEPQKRP